MGNAIKLCISMVLLVLFIVSFTPSANAEPIERKPIDISCYLLDEELHEIFESELYNTYIYYDCQTRGIMVHVETKTLEMDIILRKEGTAKDMAERYVKKYQEMTFLEENIDFVHVVIHSYDGSFLTEAKVNYE